MLRLNDHCTSLQPGDLVEYASEAFSRAAAWGDRFIVQRHGQGVVICVRLTQSTPEFGFYRDRLSLVQQGYAPPPPQAPTTSPATASRPPRLAIYSSPQKRAIPLLRRRCVRSPQPW